MRKIGHAAKFYGSSVVDLHEFLTLPLPSPTISTESISNQVLVGGDIFCFPSLKVIEKKTSYNFLEFTIITAISQSQTFYCRRLVFPLLQ